MPTLHALLIAINDYPNPMHALDGCVHDLQHIKAYLEANLPKGVEFRPKVILNEDATRANVIAGFDHFQHANDEDTCLFFFAGHGSRLDAPEAFWHLEPDHKNESLVCWDSLQEEGRALIDKELSYLIWKATNNKKTHFLVITDCCHSGAVTRLPKYKTRQVKDIEGIIPVEEYLGFSNYKKVGENAYSPPRGQYLHLAACLPHETAKEVHVDGQSRGIFTYCLVDALQKANSDLTYAEVLNRMHTRIRNNFPDQSAQLEATEALDKNLLFLSGQATQKDRSYLVVHDKKRGWIVKAGALNGLTTSEADSKTTLQIQPDGPMVNVTKVFLDSAQLAGMDQYPKSAILRAKVVERAIPKIKLALAPDNDQTGNALLKDQFLQKDSGLFELVDDAAIARYWIHAQDEHYYLTHPYTGYEEKTVRPLFQKVLGFNPEGAIDFLNKLDTVATWLQVLELSQPYSSIRSDEIQLELYRITEPGNEEDDAPKEVIDHHSSCEFSHTFYNGKWEKPGFQLKIKNTGLRDLWVSLLFLGDDFSITNQLLPKQYLEPGQEAWALDVADGQSYRTIPLQLDDHYHDWGITSITEYLKLLVSTHEMDTSNLNQKKLNPERRSGTQRSFGRRKKPEQPDWKAIDIPLKLIRPLEATSTQ